MQQLQQELHRLITGRAFAVTIIRLLWVRQQLACGAVHGLAPCDVRSMNAWQWL